MTDNPMEDVIARLRSVVETHEAKRAELKAQLDAMDLEYKRADRALKMLTGELVTGKQSRQPTSSARVREIPSRVSDERLAVLRDTVLAYAEDHEEFRQVDIRTLPNVDSFLTRSSILALGFEALRQEGTIRFARQDGNNKWFRLTRQAMNGANASS
jgi:hypothetical protein